MCDSGLLQSFDLALRLGEPRLCPFGPVFEQVPLLRRIVDCTGRCAPLVARVGGKAQGRHQQAAEDLREARTSAAVVHHAWRALHARFSDTFNLKQWRRWAELTIEESRGSGETAILVDKLRRRVALYRAGRPVAHFPAELGANGLRRKEHAGDKATPEGMYRILEARVTPATKFYKALLINYPNDEDRMRFALGQRRGAISRRAGIGSLIEIHGDGGEGRDWTDGCIALTNEDIDRLFAHVGVGTLVTIVGTYER